MNTGHIVLLFIGTGSICLADFSYSVTTKWVQPPSSQVEKYYFKGPKMKQETTGESVILDFGAHTLTRINNPAKLYSVAKFSDLPAVPKQTEVEVTFYVKETGKTRNIGGYQASEITLTIDMDSPQIRQRPAKPQSERRLWMATGVPGSEERRVFFETHREDFPWAALVDSRYDNLNAAAIAVWASDAEMERRKSELKGFPLVEIFTMRAAASGLKGPNVQDWAQARAQLEEQRKNGGASADYASQTLARADSMGGDPFAMMQYTAESSGFSTEPVPDSVFAVPPQYKPVPAADYLRLVTEALQPKGPAGPGALAGGVIGGIIGSVPSASPAPSNPQRIRVGGNVEQAKLIRQPKPVYPPLAREARISGHVILDAIINKDGTIQELHPERGHPLLASAAMEAVKKWVYQPTLFNGEPVEVVTKIDVNFTLGDNSRPLPAGQVGQHYYQVPGPATDAAQTWALVSGSLPPGLRLDENTGVIEGEPSAAGEFSFEVLVTNADGKRTFSFSLHVDATQ